MEGYFSYIDLSSEASVTDSIEIVMSKFCEEVQTKQEGKLVYLKFTCKNPLTPFEKENIFKVLCLNVLELISLELFNASSPGSSRVFFENKSFQALINVY